MILTINEGKWGVATDSQAKSNVCYPIWNTEKRGWNTDLIRSIRVICVLKILSSALGWPVFQQFERLLELYILNGWFRCRCRRDVALLISLLGLFDRVVVVAG